MSPDTTRASPQTDLPASMPERLEIELRRRVASGDDTVLKLTTAGARYGVARGKTRVALRYALSPGALTTVYETFREQGFDRIETVPTPTASPDGSSVRVIAGPARYSASTLGRNGPAPDNAEAYAQCVAAAEELLPQGRGEIVVSVRWDESVADHSAALDIEVGSELLGLVRRPGPRPDVDVHLSRARPVTMVLRHGTPATSTTMTLDAGRDHGVEVVFDPDKEALSMRAATPGPAKPSAPADAPAAGGSPGR